MRNVMIFATLALLLAACSARSAPTPLAASATSQPTGSPTSAPSATSQPTLVPTTVSSALTEPTLPVFPTFVFSLASPTPPATLELDCRLNSQSNLPDSHFGPKERFTTGWNVMNTGRAAWYPGSVALTFVAGTRMADVSTVQLKTAVQPGQSVSFSVDMHAPKNYSKYTSIWSLRRGEEYFCRVKATIYVP